MTQKKDRKKKIITTLAVGGSLAIGGGLLAKRLLKKKVVTPPNNLTVTKQPSSTVATKQTSQVIQPTEIATPVAKKPPEQKLLKGGQEENNLLTPLGKRKSDIKKGTGNKQPDLPKQPKQKLEVRKKEGLDLPKAPRQKVDVKPEPPKLGEILPKKNELENQISNTVFPSSKIVSSTKVTFPRRLRLRVKSRKPNVRLPRKQRFNVEPPLAKPRNLEDIVGSKKPVTYEDVMKGKLDENLGGDFPKLLPPSQVPSLGRIVKVKPYKKMVGGKLVTVRGYVRKNNAVLVREGVEETSDSLRRETVRKVRELRGAVRKRKERIEINNLQYQKLLDDQVSNQNNLKIQVEDSLSDLDKLFTQIDNNLQQVIPNRYKKGYKDLVSEISTVKPIIQKANLDDNFYDKSLTNLRTKVSDVVEGFDVDNQLLKEIKLEKDIRLGEIRDLRKLQKTVTENIDKELNRAKLDRKKAQELLDNYKKNYDTFTRSDKRYGEILDDLRLKRLELENIAPSTVGKDFYTKERIKLIKEIERLEKGTLKESSFKKEIERKVKELEDKIYFLTSEKAKLKDYNAEFYRKLNKYENDLSKIPTNKFFLTNEATKKNEQLNRILRDRTVKTEEYLNAVEKDIKSKIDEPLKQIEKEILELENRVKEINVTKLRELTENNIKDRELQILEADTQAEKYLNTLKELLENPDTLKQSILETVPVKKVMEASLARGKGLDLDTALSMKRKLVAKMRKEGIATNNTASRWADGYAYTLRDFGEYPLKHERFKATSKQIPHVSYLTQLSKDLEKNRGLIKAKRDLVFDTLNNYNFKDVKLLIKELKDNDLFSYYKNTNPELYKKLLAFEDLLENKVENRFKFILEDLDFQISKLDVDIDFINKELKELLDTKPKLKIKTGEKILTKDLTFEDEIKELTREEFDKRILSRHSQIEVLTRSTRKRTTLIPIYEKLNSKGFKVEGENSIFNNFRKGKLTPAQKEFYDSLQGYEKNFFKEIVAKDLDSKSMEFFYLNRANDTIIHNKTRKAKLKKVKSLIDSLNVVRGADLRGDKSQLIKLRINDSSGQLVLENYKQLNRLTNRESQILKEIEKELGITEGNAPTLSNLSFMAKVSRSNLATKSELDNLLKELNANKNSLSLNDYIYFSNILKERIRGLSNELYLNNFSDNVELVYL